MNKRWLKILAEHYPSLIVSGVCHKALAYIEELESEIDTLRKLKHHADTSLENSN